MEYFHGTDLESARDILKNGVNMEKSCKGYFGQGFYVAEEESLARSNYAEFSDDGEAAVLRIALCPDVEVFDLSNADHFERWRTSGLENRIGDDGFAAVAVSKGIRVLRDASFGGVVIYDPKAIANIELLPAVARRRQP